VPRRLKAPAKTTKKTAAIYSVEKDPMAQMLLASGFREMTDAEYKEIAPYLQPKKGNKSH